MQQSGDSFTIRKLLSGNRKLLLCMSAQEKRLEKIENGVGISNHNPENGVAELENIPFQTMDDFKRLEKGLKTNEELKKQLVRPIYTIIRRSVIHPLFIIPCG